MNFEGAAGAVAVAVACCLDPGRFSDLKTVQLLNKKTTPNAGNNCLTIGFLWMNSFNESETR
jgi:hypothetical protein